MHPKKADFSTVSLYPPELMEKAEILKLEGNRHFLEGDVQVAIRLYKQALDLLDGIPKEVNDFSDNGKASSCCNNKLQLSVDRLKSILYSNLSHVHLVLQEFGESSLAAKQAMELDACALKPVLRYIEARLQEGYPFEAFVCSLRYARPLVRVEKQQGRLTSAQAVVLLEPVEKKLQSVLGLSCLSPDIELVTYLDGVAMISRRAFAPGDVIFVERRYSSRFEMDNAPTDASFGTEEIVLHFAKRLWREQVGDTPMWRKLLQDFRGAWPRSFDEIGEETRLKVGAYLRTHLKDVTPDNFNDLLLISLMCRYNCFHSGFFRTCALANHSCRANIAMKYNVSEGAVTMIAVSPIKSGELMNVKYLRDSHFMLGVARRRELLRSWLFWCECDRCIEDSDPSSAVHEFVACQECGGYTHYPYCAFSKGDIDADPRMKTASCCRHCGAVVVWSQEKKEALTNLITTPRDGSNAKELAEWLTERLEKILAMKVFPTNWIYRIVFYMYCLSLRNILERCWSDFQTLGFGGVHVSTLATVLEVFTPCGLHKFYLPLLDKMRNEPIFGKLDNGSENESDKIYRGLLEATKQGTGCDVLRSLFIFWHLIESFYPGREMWAIHRMLCICVLLHLIFQNSLAHLDEDAQLSNEYALMFLQRHGAYLEPHEASRWMHIFQILKYRASGNTLPSLTALKKALKLK